MSGRKKSSQAKLRAYSQEERIIKWRDHFKNLLGTKPNVTNSPVQTFIEEELEIKTGPFTEEELKSVLKTLKNKKAAGLDEIPPEVWNTLLFNDVLLQACNQVYTHNSIIA